MRPSLGELRRAAIARLRAAGSPTPALDVDTLLMHGLGRDRAFILAHPEYRLTDQAAARCEALLARAAAGEPIAYLTGERGFYDLVFRVTPDVLIPRPETELLLEAALQWARMRLEARPHTPLTIVDVGTGSGALAVTLARHLPPDRVCITGIDSSPAALAVARENAAALLDAARAVTWLESDLLTAWPGTPIDLLVANLPYIPSAVVPTLAVSRFEPASALDGGPDGLDLIRRLLDQVQRCIAPDGLIALEIGADQGVQCAAEARVRFPGARIELRRDYAGHDRVVLVEM
ncbi:MAG: peptide chain release factor N(5)-glutamine methyltransferase [Candidatus Flexifilum sp.]|jgi:release factor glutamine methyltransferase